MKVFALFRVLAVAASAVWFASCNDGGGDGGSSDVGDNDANTVVCIGDSITKGTCAPAGAPYPSRLAGLSGKNVINAGVCGERSFDTVDRAPGVLAKYKPGFMCLLIGANNASFGDDPVAVGEDIRRIIQAAKGQKTIPLVGTLTPTYGPHGFSNAQSMKISEVIRQVAKEEGARLVDLEKEFGSDRTLIQEDGLHPSDSGTQLIALSFNDEI